MARKNEVKYIHPICVRLWQKRKQKHISAAELAKITGYDQGTLLRWENGITSPTIAQVMDWAIGLNFDLEFSLEINIQKLEGQPYVQPHNPLWT